MDPVVVSAVVQIRADASYSPQKSVVTPTPLAATTWRTDLDISGAGYLHYLEWSVDTGMYTQAYLRVTIDGGTPQTVGANISSNMVSSPLRVADVRFKTSLKVEVYNSDSSTRDVGTTIVYSRT